MWFLGKTRHVLLGKSHHVLPGKTHHVLLGKTRHVLLGKTHHVLPGKTHFFVMMPVLVYTLLRHLSVKKYIHRWQEDTNTSRVG